MDCFFEQENAAEVIEQGIVVNLRLANHKFCDNRNRQSISLVLKI